MILSESLVQYLAISSAIREVAIESFGEADIPLSAPEFVFENGGLMEGRSKVDPSLYLPRSKQCYLNAWNLKESHKGYRYCEGYMLLEGIPIPILHAWCINEADEVVDTSIEMDAIAAYYGVEFNPEFAARSWETLRRYNLIGILANHEVLNINTLETLKGFLINPRMTPS